MFTGLHTFLERKEVLVKTDEVVCIYSAAEEFGDKKTYIGATGLILRSSPWMALYVVEKPEVVAQLIAKSI